MTPQQRAILETIARQACIPKNQRVAYVAGAEWAFANLSENRPTTMRSETEIRAEIERIHQQRFMNDVDDTRVLTLRWVLNEATVK